MYLLYSVIILVCQWVPGYHVFGLHFCQYHGGGNSIHVVLIKPMNCDNIVCAQQLHFTPLKFFTELLLKFPPIFPNRSTCIYVGFLQVLKQFDCRIKNEDCRNKHDTPYSSRVALDQRLLGKPMPVQERCQFCLCKPEIVGNNLFGFHATPKFLWPNFVGFFGIYWIKFTLQPVPIICSSTDKLRDGVYCWRKNVFSKLVKLPSLNSLLSGSSCWLPTKCRFDNIWKNLLRPVTLGNQGTCVMPPLLQ